MFVEKVEKSLNLLWATAFNMLFLLTCCFRLHATVRATCFAFDLEDPLRDPEL